MPVGRKLYLPMQHTSPPSPEHVYRLSLSWLVAGLVAVLVVGLCGGLIAQQVWQPPVTPLTNDIGQLVTTVQNVTISPSTATAELVERTNRSVVLIGRLQNELPSVSATGFVLTNDGLVVSANNIEGPSLIALDFEGRVLPLERLGRDELFGLSYFRLPDSVVVPLDVRQNDPPIGHELTAISRTPTTALPRLGTFLVTEYSLPVTGSPVGVQRYLQSGTNFDDAFIGSPLLDEEGRVAGIITNTEQGEAMAVSLLQTSAGRVSNGQREFNPYALSGFTGQYTFSAPNSTNPIQFGLTVTGITPASPAADAGLERGDVITTINTQALAWHRSVIPDMGATLPLTLTILHDGQSLPLTLQPTTPPAR